MLQFLLGHYYIILIAMAAFYAVPVYFCSFRCQLRRMYYADEFVLITACQVRLSIGKWQTTMFAWLLFYTLKPALQPDAITASLISSHSVSKSLVTVTLMIHCLSLILTTLAAFGLFVIKKYKAKR